MNNTNQNIVRSRHYIKALYCFVTTLVVAPFIASITFFSFTFGPIIYAEILGRVPFQYPIFAPRQMLTVIILAYVFGLLPAAVNGAAASFYVLINGSAPVGLCLLLILINLGAAWIFFDFYYPVQGYFTFLMFAVIIAAASLSAWTAVNKWALKP